MVFSLLKACQKTAKIKFLWRKQKSSARIFCGVKENPSILSKKSDVTKMRACALWLNKESYLYIQWRHRSGRNGSDSAVGAPTGEPRKKEKKAPLPRLLQLLVCQNNVRSFAKCVFWVFGESVEVFCTQTLELNPSGFEIRGVTEIWTSIWPAWNWIR